MNYQETFKHYAKLIFAIGDSLTQGTGLPVDAAYPFQLDLLLNFDNKVYFPMYGVVNLGQDGIGTKQSIAILDKYSDLLKPPDFILYLGAPNDYVDDLVWDIVSEKIPLQDNPNAFPILVWLLNHTKTVQTLYGIYFSRLRRQLLISKTKNYHCAALQEKVFDKLLEKASESEAKLIVSWEDYSESYIWLQEWARKNNVLFADWYPGFFSVTKEIPNMPVRNSHSAGHYRAWVNHMIAKAFACKIKEAE